MVVIVLPDLMLSLLFSFHVTSCAFVSNLNETSAMPSLQPDHTVMQSVLERDLLMNVFRDGHWGTFRHQRITDGTKILINNVSNSRLTVNYSVQPHLFCKIIAQARRVNEKD